MPPHGAYLYFDVGQGTSDPPSDPYGWIFYCGSPELCERLARLLEYETYHGHHGHHGFISWWTAEELGDDWILADEQIEWLDEEFSECNDTRYSVRVRAFDLLARLTQANAVRVAEPPQLPPEEQASTPEDDSAPLSQSQVEVLVTMADFDGSRLLSSQRVAEAMAREKRLNQETVRQCIARLIELGFVERPEGPKSGARLTRSGRAKAGQLAE